MDKLELLKLYDKDLRERVEYPEARKEVTADVVRFVREAPGMNFISYTYAGEFDLDRVIKNELGYFAPLNQPFTWKVCDHDPFPNAGEILKSNGFVRDDDPGEVMLLDLEHAPAQLLKPVTADVRRISDPEDLKDIIFVLDNVWGGSNTWVNARLGGHLKVPGYLSAYVGYVADIPASIGWTYFPKGHFATLFAGSTLPEYRKHGLYTSILATRVQEILQRGYRYAVVEAGDMSKPIVQKHGFEYLTTAWDYILEQKEEE
jgi:GNAT superfamily N-acetyltransferase